MGKSYATELKQLGTTYRWAAEVDIEGLVSAISTTATFPLMTVGSGGSFSVAHHASGLHQEYTGLLSKAVTPLEFVRSSIHLGATGVLLFSAGGTNADIIGSFRNLIEREPRCCTVLCLRRGSTLSKLAAQYQFIRLIEMVPPIAKDGFLSTNSLLAFAVVLERAYSQAFGSSEILPKTLDGLHIDRLIGQLREECKPLWKRDTILVLHETALGAAAIDLESKFSEAALGNVQVVDFRNFAHGRHNWVAKRDKTTGVLALFSDQDRELAEATLRLLPSNVPVARIDLPTAGAPARIAALLAVLNMVGDIGQARGIDPGRPHVPAFGRKIYHLQAFSKSRLPRLFPETIPIARKVAEDPHHLTRRPDLEVWRKAYYDFVTSLGEATFGAILFDYDGTLCEGRDRFSGLREEVSSALKRILAARIPIGIATGRGKSVRENLRKAFPHSAWANVFIGYYNGTDIARLKDDAAPNVSAAPVGSLSAAADALSRHSIIGSVAIIEVRPCQISIQPTSLAAFEIVWHSAVDIVQSHSGLRIVRSSHSVDILPQTISKTALLKDLSEVVAPKLVLCIGDMGRWPGNDHDILATRYSLSVDEVSMATASCWNIAPAGYRGVQATIHYLDALKVSQGYLRVDVEQIQQGTPRNSLHE